MKIGELMRVVDITGGTACLREADEIRQRDRKRVVSASLAAAGAMEKIAETDMSREDLESINVAELGLTFDEAEAFQVLQKAMIVASIAAWSLPSPVPTWETVEDLPANIYQELASASQEDLNAVISGTNFSPGDPSSSEFTQSPTLPSADSDKGLRAEQESESTLSQEGVGKSTASVQ